MKGRSLLALGSLALLGAVAVKATAPVSVQEEVILEDRLPRAISEFGFFADPASQLPAPDVVGRALEARAVSGLRGVFERTPPPAGSPQGGTEAARVFGFSGQPEEVAISRFPLTGNLQEG